MEDKKPLANRKSSRHAHQAAIREKGIGQRLKAGEILVADGAMGTMLMNAGLAPGVAAESWNVAYPQRVKEVHLAYIRAGSQIILTNTFGGSRLKLKRSGKEGQVEAFNRQGALLAREAAGAKAYVAGDIGPSGELMAPMGTLTYEQAVENFAEQAGVLAAGGVDLLWIETMMDLEEARAAVVGARQASSLPLFCSLSFGAHGRTIMGVSAQQALETLGPLGLTAVGANCGDGPEEMAVALDQMGALGAKIALIAKANAGKPRVEDGKTVYDIGPMPFAAKIERFVKQGAKIVGACCGSNPEFIAAINGALGRSCDSPYETTS